ncbi:MAG: methyltransferase domain-containing protein [Candidatus Pacebacteria bacterium]|nr:methyltransferase domain-containing protein [Candidatus Paceibacterota bacterium]
MTLNNRMLAADFGCGSGEWVLALAEILENGKVYAVDLLDEPVSALKSKARGRNLKNIEIVKSDVEKTIVRLLANSLDLVLITNLLFQVRDKKSVLAEAARVLKSGGKLLIVDWSERTDLGPAQKLNYAEIKDMAHDAGFLPDNEFEAGSFHVGLVFAKK